MSDGEDDRRYRAPALEKALSLLVPLVTAWVAKTYGMPEPLPDEEDALPANAAPLRRTEPHRGAGAMSRVSGAPPGVRVTVSFRPPPMWSML